MGSKGSIRDYFQPARAPAKLTPGMSSSVSQPQSQPLSKSQIIKCSDDEGSDSDSSLEDITELFQSKSSNAHTHTKIPTTPARDNRPVKPRNLHASPLAVLPKYQFDLKTLASEAQKHEAAEARAMRMKVMVEEERAAAELKSPHLSSSGLLQSVAASNDDGDVDKVMRAVQRTEATHAVERWYFFESTAAKKTDRVAAAFPYDKTEAEWQRELLTPANREQTILSGFVRDMAVLGEYLPHEILLWILDEVCFEIKDDLRNSYYDILFSSSDLLPELLRPDIIRKLFKNLGSRTAAIDMEQTVKTRLIDPHLYDNREWINLQTIIHFFGRTSMHTSGTTNAYIISLILRLCADSIVMDNVSILSTIQDSLLLLSNNIEEEMWEPECQSICNLLFTTIEQVSLRAQILQCLPSSSARLHDIRRRLALASLFQDLQRTTSPAYETIDLWEITKLLDSPMFRITDHTDYHELAALMSMLDVAIDNGISMDMDHTDPAGEQEFNADVDALAQRIKGLWSNINDSGASFISRIDAKEVMEGVRHRLMYAVRTKPKPKCSMFETIPDNTEQIQKQSIMMNKYFGKTKDGTRKLER